MVHYDPEFKAPIVQEHEKESGISVDSSVSSALPTGHQIISVTTHGASFWARTTRIDTQVLDGTKKAYFLKVSTDDIGRHMVMAEFESMKALHAVIPANIPQPLAWGTYADDPKKHFYLAEFCDMKDELPNVSNFVSIIAQLHENSGSPTGKFGFHVTTYAGNQPMDNTWCVTWEEFFIRAMWRTVQNEISVQGESNELYDLTQKLCTTVVPRLLRPLETGDRKIKPSLVHGDLWHGNVAIEVENDNTILFDGCALYAHNEFEMGFWRASRYDINRDHILAYHEGVAISAPVEDYEERNALYALRVDLLVSALYPSNKRMRQLAVEEMRRLIEKYPQGVDGYRG